MLVLSRKQNEKIVLPDLGVTIRVLRVTGNTVKIGIEAPRNVDVVRGEIVAQSRSMEQCRSTSQGHSTEQSPAAQEPPKRSNRLRRETNRPSEPMTSPTGKSIARQPQVPDTRCKQASPVANATTAGSVAAAR